MSDAYVRIDEKALTALFESSSGPVAKDLKRRAIKVTRRAKRLCPVDTGRLQGSIVDEMGAERGDLVARIGTDVEYAPFVELGTSRAGAQAFLRPALDAAR